MKCKECGNEFKGQKCSCGWSPAGKTSGDRDWAYDRCAVVVEGRRCLFPATIYGMGGCRWGSGECRLHDGQKGGYVVEVIAESELWYARRQEGKDVPLFYARPNGAKLPGYPSQGQLQRQHAEWLKQPPAKRYARQPDREPGQDEEEIAA